MQNQLYSKPKIKIKKILKCSQKISGPNFELTSTKIELLKLNFHELDR